MQRHGKLKQLLSAMALASGLAALPACVSTSPDARLAAVLVQVEQAGWLAMPLPTSQFTLMAFGRPAPHAHPVLRVYIEGDGFAWVDPYTPSFDPTPSKALALTLAQLDPALAVVYLGRPCQYVRGLARQGCDDNRWWTSHRFAPAVMQSTHAALDTLKQRYQASQLELVGYSGGGTVAAVVAAQRNDVRRLVTVAGNLDPATWTRINRLSPLVAVQNPADMAAQLAHLPQLHFVGRDDPVIPPAISQSYQQGFAEGSKPQVRMIEGFNHHCCWAQAWHSLLQEAFPAPLP